VNLTVAALRAADAVARVAPAPVANGFGEALGAGASRLSADERRIVERNLRRARGGSPEGRDGRAAGRDGRDRRRGRLAPERDIRRVFASYGRYWVDTLRLPHLDADAIARGFTVDGFEHVEAAMDAGTAPILALPHLGGWEWAARWLVAVRGYGVAAVVEELEPPEMYEWFLEQRRRLGMHIIPLSPRASAEVAAALANREIVCLLCDRDISGNGIEVEFFGEATRLPGGPALMALRTGAPLLPSAVYFEGSRCHGIVEAPLDTTRRGRLRDDVTRITQDLARVLERQIRRAPEQWHLLQPNWPSDFVALGRPVPDAG